MTYLRYEANNTRYDDFHRQAKAWRRRSVAPRPRTRLKETK